VLGGAQAMDFVRANQPAAEPVGRQPAAPNQPAATSRRPTSRWSQPATGGIQPNRWRPTGRRWFRGRWPRDAGGGPARRQQLFLAALLRQSHLRPGVAAPGRRARLVAAFGAHSRSDNAGLGQPGQSWHGRCSNLTRPRCSGQRADRRAAGHPGHQAVGRRPTKALFDAVPHDGPLPARNARTVPSPGTARTTVRRALQASALAPSAVHVERAQRLVTRRAGEPGRRSLRPLGFNRGLGRRRTALGRRPDVDPGTRRTAPTRPPRSPMRFSSAVSETVPG